jgi:hypothetical protein
MIRCAAEAAALARTCAGQFVLREVQIHLIAVKVSVVSVAVGVVHADDLVVHQDTGLVRHDARLVQCRLAIDEEKVACEQLTKDHLGGLAHAVAHTSAPCAAGKQRLGVARTLLARLLCQIDTPAVLVLNEVGPGINLRAILNEAPQHRNIVGCDLCVDARAGVVCRSDEG